jgi:hypothetical protein
MNPSVHHSHYQNVPLSSVLNDFILTLSFDASRKFIILIPPDTVRAVKSKRMRRVDHVIHIGEMTNAYGILVVKFESFIDIGLSGKVIINSISVTYNKRVVNSSGRNQSGSFEHSDEPSSASIKCQRLLFV